MVRSLLVSLIGLLGIAASTAGPWLVAASASEAQIFGPRRGTFEAHRDGRKLSSLEYPEKRFSSGKIGFLWGGNIAGTIGSLEVTGRIDTEKMAKELSKRLGLGA